MARLEKYTKEFILQKCEDFIKKEGIANLNARSIAKYMECSTQPIFRIWKNLDDLKKDIKIQLRKNYTTFINSYIKDENYLFTISYAYALYAKDEPNIFIALFLTDFAGTRTIKEVINSYWNRDTIEAMTKTYNLTLKEAEDVYRDVRFFTHGIATQLCAKSIKLENEEISTLIDNMISICVKNKKGL